MHSSLQTLQIFAVVFHLLLVFAALRQVLQTPNFSIAERPETLFGHRPSDLNGKGSFSLLKLHKIVKSSTEKIYANLTI